MNESLVQKTSPVFSGVNLNREDDILLSESGRKNINSSNMKEVTKSDINVLESSQEISTDIVNNELLSDSFEFLIGKDCLTPNINSIRTNIKSDQNENKNSASIEQVKRISLDVVNQIIEEAENKIEELLRKNKSQDKCNSIFETGQVEKNYCEIIESNEFIPNSRANSRKMKCKNNGTFGSKEHLEIKNDKEVCMQSNFDISAETTCGFRFFKPSWLQKWATAKTYVILYAIFGVLDGSYYSYNVGAISTLERRFAFKSKISGVIMIADDFVPLFFGFILGYFAGKSHRPRCLAVGMLMSAACCFASSLPYFIYGSGKHLSFWNIKNQTEPEFCANDVKYENCNVDDRPPTLPAVTLLILGSFLKGFGTLTYHVIGLAYMDDNSEEKDTPIHLTIALALRLLGPLVGFLMSSISLKFYENPFEDPGYGPEDPRWIGAWWMGFFVQGVLLVIFTIPIAFFPRRLPGHKQPDQLSSSDETWKDLFKGMLLALKRLWTNPIFVFLAINTTMKIFGHFGHAIMLPKYMENQFRLSASDASLFSGATSIACIMVATVLGGLLIWKYRPSAKTILAGLVASEVILCLGYLILMIPRCQPAEMLHYGSNHDGLILNSTCNRNCDCSTTSFTPFCGPDGKTAYFSPCFAGCTLQLDSVMTDKEHKEFGNCSCVADENGDIGAKITEGFCVDENCWTQTLAYICVLLILVTISNTLTVAHTIILLRSVHPNDKSVALGTFETFICLFGFIPFPVSFGAIVDSACLIWEKSCGQTGNCWFYDMEKYNYLLHGASSFFCFISICCLTTLYCLSNRLKNLYEDEENKESVTSIKLDTVSGTVTKL